MRTISARSTCVAQLVSVSRFASHACRLAGVHEGDWKTTTVGGSPGRTGLRHYLLHNLRNLESGSSLPVSLPPVTFPPTSTFVEWSAKSDALAELLSENSVHAAVPVAFKD